VSVEKAFEVPSIVVNDLGGILSGTADPTAPGLNAPIGSIYLRDNGGVGEHWKKIDALDTDWEIVTSAAVAGDLEAVVLSNTTSSAIASPAFANVTWNTTHIENVAAVIEHDGINTERILIKDTGLYFLNADVSYDADALEEQIDFRFLIDDTTEVPGSLRTGTDDDEIGAASLSIVALLTAGQYLTFQIQASGAGNLLHSSTRISVISAKGVKGADGAAGADGADGAGAPPRVFDVYDNTGGQLLDTITPIIFNLDTVRKDSGGGSFTLAADELTINVTGTYEISFRVGATRTTGTRTTLRAWLELNSVEVLGTTTKAYIRTLMTGTTTTTTLILDLTAGDILRISGILDTAATTATTLARHSSLTVKTLAGTPAAGGGGGFQGFGIWRYRTAVDAFPLTGRIHFNNATVDLATEMYVHKTNDGGTDMTNFLNLLGVDDLIYLQDKTDATKFIIVELGVDPELNGNVYTFKLDNSEGQGTGITNNTEVTFLAIHSGDGVGVPLPTPDPITFVASTEATSTVNSVTINVPAGTVDGDNMVLVVTQTDGEDGVISAIAGWDNPVANAGSGGAAPSTPETSIFTRKALSEPASYIATCTVAVAVGMVAKMSSWRTADPTTILDVAITLDTHTATANPNPPANTPITRGCVSLPVWWHDDDLGVYGSVPAGYTDPNGLGSVVTAGGGNGCSLGWAYEILTGDVGIIDPAAFNVTDDDEGGTAHILLRPANEANPGAGAPEIIFGTEYNTAASLGLSTTTSSTFQQKLKMSVVVPAGDYYLAWAMTSGNTGTEQGVDGRVQLDDSTDLTEFTTRGRDGSNWDSPRGGHQILTLNGAHDIDVDYNAAGGTATIKDVTLTLWRVT